MSSSKITKQEAKPSLKELALVFFRLGMIAFGGPAAHIAMMDQEVVQRKRWTSRENLLDLIGVTNLLPGPNSTELAIHIGYEQRGWFGLFVAGSCFILPAMTMVWLLSILYVRFQTVPQLIWLLYSIKPVIVAVVAQALWKLGKKALKDRPTSIAGILAIAAYLARFNEVALLLLLGLAVMIYRNWQNKPTINSAILFLSPELFATAEVSTSAFSVAWSGVFLYFLKIGSILYGSGYVLLAFLQRDLVEGTQWLTSQQLLDAIAIGQITPGPVLTTATFIGYLLAGNLGAIAGTLGIFLPAFLLVGIVNPWIPKLRQSRWARGFLDGINAASLGFMAGVTYALGRAAVIDWFTLFLAITSAIAVFKFKVNSIWLVIFGGMIGLVAYLGGLTF